jgi:hypothetical protein
MAAVSTALSTALSSSVHSRPPDPARLDGGAITSHPNGGVTMNTTTTRVAKYAGAGLAGIATSCVLAAPALAMRPDPTPGSGQHQRIYESDIIANSASTKDPAGPAASPGNARLADHWDGHTGSPATATGTNPTSGGADWSNLATAFGGGVVLTGAIAMGATQLHRRQTRPA